MVAQGVRCTGVQVYVCGGRKFTGCKGTHGVYQKTRQSVCEMCQKINQAGLDIGVWSDC